MSGLGHLQRVMVLADGFSWNGKTYLIPSPNLGFILIDDQLAVFDVIPEGRHAAHPNTLHLGGGDLVPYALSNDLALELGAKDNSMFSVSRPMLVMVLNCWVMDTNETPRRSQISTSLAKSESARVSRPTL
jgi:hypothetical protein